MNTRMVLLAISLLLISNSGTFASIRIKANSSSSTVANYEHKKAELFGYFTRYRPAALNLGSPSRQKNLATKIGLGMMMASGVILICGLTWLTAAPKHGAFDFGPEGAWEMIIGSLILVALGGAVTAIGAVHKANNKFSLIAPKANEMGIAYKFM